MRSLSYRASVGASVAFFGAALLASSGCSSPQPAAAFCATDPRVQTFTPGLEEKGVSTGITAELLTATPSLVQQGLNEWTVELLDSSGQPLDGATIDVKPTMPDHGHGSPTLATVTPEGQGRYDLSNINLSMRGVWLVTLAISSPQGSDSVAFTFCVDGTT